MISDGERRHLHQQAEQAMGAEAANTLMGYLPPESWQHLATKADVERVEARVDRVETRLEARIDVLSHQVDGRIHQAEARLLRAYWFGTIALIVGLASVSHIAELLFG